MISGVLITTVTENIVQDTQTARNINMAVKREKDRVKQKSNKDSILSVKPTTNEQWDEYLSTISFQMCPANNQFKDRLAIELVEWSKSDEALILEEFYDIKGIRPNDIKRWLETHTGLQEAFERAKRVISYRREKGALRNELNPGTVHIVMPHYSKIWKDTEEWRAGLKKESDKQGDVRVVIESYPESSLVPDRKVE